MRLAPSGKALVLVMLIYYDPSSNREEEDFHHLLVRAIMEKISISSFLHFDSKKPLMLAVLFTFMRPHIFQAFPHCKDLDNLVKFIIDACHDVLYTNDNVVMCLVVEKGLHRLTWW